MSLSPSLCSRDVLPLSLSFLHSQSLPRNCLAVVEFRNCACLVTERQLECSVNILITSSKVGEIMLLPGLVIVVIVLIRTTCIDYFEENKRRNYVTYYRNKEHTYICY